MAREIAANVRPRPRSVGFNSRHTGFRRFGNGFAPAPPDCACRQLASCTRIRGDASRHRALDKVRDIPGLEANGKRPSSFDASSTRPTRRRPRRACLTSSPRRLHPPRRTTLRPRRRSRSIIASFADGSVKLSASSVWSTQLNGDTLGRQRNTREINLEAAPLLCCDVGHVGRMLTRCARTSCRQHRFITIASAHFGYRL